MDDAYELAITCIPELLVPSGKIIIDGYINNKLVKILIDTGANSSVIFTSSINRLNLNDIVDDEVDIKLNGIGMKKIHKAEGIIWYIELLLANYNFPIALIVSASTKLSNTIDIVIGSNFLQKYEAQIDFKNMIIKFSDKYELSFDYN
jgi:predicted aspartyl protease